MPRISSSFQGNVPNLLGAKESLPRPEDIPRLERTMFKQILYESDLLERQRAKEQGTLGPF